MSRFEHIFDFCFSVKTDEANPDNISGKVLRDQLCRRIFSIDDNEMQEACGHVDTECLDDDALIHAGILDTAVLREAAIRAAGDELRRIVNIPGEAPTAEWASEEEIDNAIAAWDSLWEQHQSLSEHEK